jgi:thioredoxin reductase (NADPH)
MSGTEFLEKSIEYYPETRKVLLTAYADTDAAITSINSINLDYYLMKPWDPPEQHLYPVLDDLLSDWQATVVLPYDGIRVAGTQWSVSSHQTKDFLARNQIPYQWLDIEKDEQAKALVRSISEEEYRLPVVFFPDGTLVVNPNSRELAEKVGLRRHAQRPFYDLVIVGAGPAGLAAAVHGASEGLSTVLIEKDAVGGQAGTSARIENYLGFPRGVSGSDLARRAATQAKRLGAEILAAEEVKQIRVEDPYRLVVLGDGTELSCHALLIATGMSFKKPEIAGIERLIGASVYYGAAITEAKNYSGGRVIVIGGANSAGQGAVFLSQYVNEVTMIVRGPSLAEGMSKYLIDQIEGIRNINVLLQTEVTAAEGEDRLKSVRLKDRGTGKVKMMPADAIFIFVGAFPRSDIAATVIELSEEGFILTGSDLTSGGRRLKNWTVKRDPYPMETSVPGIFAAGDVRHNAVRRVASAVGQGAVAVTLIQEYLETV